MRLYQVENNMRGINEYKSSPYIAHRSSGIAKSVQAKDYFGTTATVVDLCAQLLEQKETTTQVKTDNIQNHLASVRDELMFIQENFELKEKL